MTGVQQEECLNFNLTFTCDPDSMASIFLGAAEPPATPTHPSRNAASSVRDCLFVQGVGLFGS